MRKFILHLLIKHRQYTSQWGRFWIVGIWGETGERRVTIKIEAGSEGARSVSTSLGARRFWYSSSWLQLGDTFLGVECGTWGSLPASSGSLLTLLGPLALSSNCSACRSPKNLTGRNGSNVGRQRVGRSCSVRAGSQSLQELCAEVEGSFSPGCT